MENKVVVQTPFQKAHVHFYDYIESFPGLPEPETHEDRHNRILGSIKSQFINGNEEKAKECTLKLII
jgi:hypothetical protein